MTFQKIDKWTATAVVVANMVGTGVFTSLGFQLLNINNAWSIVLLWIVGGMIALSGAFTYAEIGSYFIKNGGEYVYLNRLFHPALGFIAGFVSIIVGFAAPIAAACVAFGKYLSYTLFSSSESFTYSSWLAIFVLTLISSVHLLNIKVAGNFQKVVTLLKIVIMILFGWAFMKNNANPAAFEWDIKTIANTLVSPAFAVSLIYVSYAYSGWNAAAYIADEIEKPEKNLALSIIIGTFIVLIFYVLLNLSFLYSTPIQELKGNVEVGIISAHFIFGQQIGNIIGLLISILLISTISSMMMAAPRVLASIGEDFQILSVFNQRNKYQSPYVSVLFIYCIAMLMILSSSFQWLINYIGITLIIFTTITALGIFILRKRKDYSPIFKMPFYPLPALIFIVLNGWILVYMSLKEFSVLIFSLMTIFVGWMVYLWIQYFSPKRND